MSYILGLDIGITSAGYAVILTNHAGKPFKIAKLNTVIFPLAEDPQSGASLALPTRQHRSSRRLNRRTKFRKYRVRQLFLRYHLLNPNDISRFLSYQVPHQDIWQLRTLALQQKITNAQLFEIFYYFAGHRGFKSNRRSEIQPRGKSDADTRKVLSNITTNQEKITQYPSLGAMMAELPEFESIKHNKNYRSEDIYPLRRWIVDEIRTIGRVQKQFGHDLPASFINDYIKIFQAQRDFDKGPAKPSRFGGNLIEKMVGVDSLDHSQKRAAKLTDTFFRFQLLSQLNSLAIRYDTGQDFEPLTPDQRQVILDAASLKQLSFKQIRKKLDLTDTARFNLINYYPLKKDKTPNETVSRVEKKLFFKYGALTDLRQITSDPARIDQIGTILTTYKGDAERQKRFQKLGLTPNQIDQLLPINATGFGHLSLKTMRAILPYLADGEVYSEAATHAGYDFRDNKIDREYLRENITNPVVNRAIAKTLKVVHAVIAEYGKPDAIHIELTRELRHSHDERKKIDKRQQANQEKNQRVANQLTENGIPVTGINIIKQKLFDEQGGIDLYSGNQINAEKLFSDQLFEIDHIIPYSKSFDDSFTNKVVTATHNNQSKADRTPLEFLGTTEAAKAAFKTRVLANIQNSRKRQNLLKEHFTAEDRQAWKTRNINDTGYINRILSQYLLQNIEFTGVFTQPVVTVNGALTAYVRKRFGISKDRQASDLHHAVDAAFLACITPAYVQRLAHYSQQQENRYDQQLWQIDRDHNFNGATAISYQQAINMFPAPWPNFRAELIGRTASDPAQMMAGHLWDSYTTEEIKHLRPAIVIRMANHKVTGAAHKETIYSSKIYHQTGLGLIRTPIDKLSYDAKKDIIKNYPLAPDKSNQVVYNALKRVLKRHAGQKKSPFSDHRLTIQVGHQKQIVTHVKTTQKISSPTAVGQGIALNSRMLRIDIFLQADSQNFVGVPVYVADAVAKHLPDKAVVTDKNASDWLPIHPADQFICSVATNDLIEVKFKKPVTITNISTGEKQQRTQLLCYFSGFSIAKAQMNFRSLNGDYTINSIVLKYIQSITRFQLDYLGNYYPIKHEHRTTFH